MTTILLGVLWASAAFILYTYLGYPAILRLLAGLRRERRPDPPAEWPRISITVPAFNEEATIRSTIESLLALDYPADRRQILVVSDASTDRTDEIVSDYADRGVELFRVNRRAGKTAAENAARRRLTGDIIVNTDASVRVHPSAIKALVTWFEDPTVGVASGRDVSVAAIEDSSNVGEKGYVGYEMWVRALESRVASIVQASGCLYAALRKIHDRPLLGHLTRDFAAVAFAREEGYRSVSVDEAICHVPRQRSLRREYRRKVRTMTRGLHSLFSFHELLNPLRYGIFGWMLFSHKLCRWLVPVAFVAGACAMTGLSAYWLWARLALAAGAGGLILAAAGWLWSDEGKAPRPVTIAAYLLMANAAALHAWLNLLRGEKSPEWSPTRREAIGASNEAGARGV